MQLLYWGIIGPGGIAHQFAESLTKSESGKLYAVASRNIERAHAFSSQYQVEHSYGSYEQLLADDNVQVQVKEPYIELHSGPAGGFPVIYVAARNEWITVLKRRTNWFKVATHKGVQGWVKQQALQLAKLTLFLKTNYYML